MRYQSDCHVHLTCFCYWLANYFSQSFALDACASVDVLNLSYCIIVLTRSLHLPLQSTMSTCYFHSPHLHLLVLFSYCMLVEFSARLLLTFCYFVFFVFFVCLFLALLFSLAAAWRNKDVYYSLGLYYWIVLLCYCITPSVYSEYRFFSLLLTHMSACVCIFSCRKDDLFVYY